MDLQTAHDTWHRLLAGETHPAVEKLTAAIGSAFLTEADRNPTAALPYIELLTAMATHHELPVARAATSALFGTIIERLCDDFSAKGVELANLVLITMLDSIRRTSAGRQLDQLLTDHGFQTGADILQHYQKLRNPAPLTEKKKALVKKILILSRVTAGADIAITSIIIERFHRALPQAELILIGPRHLGDLFGTLHYIGWRPFEYKNRGDLFDKMTSWPPLLAIVQQEQAGLCPGEVLLIDPDSRLSQLGLLPLLAEEYTYYFNSRALGEKSELSLSALTHQWLNQFLPPEPFQYPRLTIADPGHHCQQFCARLREGGCRFLILMNWGVGHNISKRIPDPFEEHILLALLAEPATIVLLDSGTSQRCGTQVQRLLAAAQAKRIPTAFYQEHQLQAEPIPFTHGVIGLQGSLATLGACIAQADLFLGYDSCPQHLAAAVDTESIILFAGAPSPRFMSRWCPDNPRLTAIPIAPQSCQSEEAQQTLLRNVLQQVATIRKKARKGDATFL